MQLDRLKSEFKDISKIIKSRHKTWLYKENRIVSPEGLELNLSSTSFYLKNKEIYYEIPVDRIFFFKCRENEGSLTFYTYGFNDSPKLCFTIKD